MFKIENYIAPLILNKLEKYVKNINQQDFQVSLWQGDVAFQNLELKLDVLEDELQLPFTFLSGHVNDLKIQIPWTKLSSEPIIVTINTIELVIKLKDTLASNAPQKSRMMKKNTEQEDAQPPGYMASLINKIVHNISIVCNNIVLKFIEEDIVLSMNVQHLSVHSADQRWKRSFIADVSPMNVLFRKLINIIDFTVCIDRRNSSGKIEHVAEPVLYKCSMEMRLYRRFNSVLTNQSVTRIDVKIDCLNLNISSQHFSMIFRIYDLFIAFKTGRFQSQYIDNVQHQAANENTYQEEQDSWVLWAWNMIPAILTDEESTEQDESNEKIVEFGLYIEDVKLMLKTQEILSDPIIPSTKKAVFKPILIINMQEFYNIVIINGVRKFNINCGIGYAEIEASTECPCGATTTEKQLITIGEEGKTGKYLTNSFMDKSASSISSRYDRIWQNYYENHTEDFFLTKSSAFAMDILHSIEIPEDVRSSDVGSDLEFSNYSESYVIRVFSNKVNVNLSPDLVHRVHKLMQYFVECDFTYVYLEEQKQLLKNQLPPATSDDYDALTNEVPLRTVSLKMKKVTLKVKEWNHEKHKLSRKLVKQSNLTDARGTKVISMLIRIDTIAADINSPLYPNRLLYTACQLPNSTSNQLYEKCFLTLHSCLKNIRVDLKYEKEKRICEILNLSLIARKLLYPDLWSDMDIPVNFYETSVDGFSLMITPPQLSSLHWILSNFTKTLPCNDMDKCFLEELEMPNLVVVQIVTQKLNIMCSETTLSFFIEILLSDVLGLAWRSGKKSLIINWPDTAWKPHEYRSSVRDKKKRNFMIDLKIQWPKKIETQPLLPVISLQVQEGSINFDPLLREFLSYPAAIENCSRSEKNLRTISSSSKQPINRDIFNSILSSSECDRTLCQENIKDHTPIMDPIETYKNFIFHLEIKPIQVYHTTNLLESSKPSDSLYALLTNSNDRMILVNLPMTTIHSVKNRNFSERISKHMKIELPTTMWGNEKASTWNFEFSNISARFMKNGKSFDLLQPFSLSISVADESVTDEDSYISGNLLIETSPINFSIHMDILESLRSAVSEIANFPIFEKRNKPEDEMKNDSQKALTIIPESPRVSSEIKDFLGITTASTMTKMSFTERVDRNKMKPRCNLYVQWICSKISVNLLAYQNNIKKKLSLEIDEVLISLHHQRDFYQLKSKISSISSCYFGRLGTDDKWNKDVALGMSVRPDDTSDGRSKRFFELTLTKADTTNVHSKWNIAQKRNQLYNENITEVNICLQAVDLILDIEELKIFMPLFEIITKKNVDAMGASNNALAGSELPLLHANFKGFRIFLPCHMNEKKSPDVLIIRIDGVSVTPTAVNNLIRNQIIRPDIHSKAFSLGLLDLAGSKIEDRQYQIIIRGVSFNTSDWLSISTLMNDKSSAEDYTDNPAFEWNTLEDGPKSPKFSLNTIFKDSTFSFIYAPSIKFQQTLVAGVAMEFNCVNEMEIDLTLNEILLLLKLNDQFDKLLSSNMPNKVTQQKYSGKNKQVEHRSFIEKRSNEDSGVGSLTQSKERKTWKRKLSVLNEEVHIPSEFTFTSSKFRINCRIEGRTKICSILDTPNLFMTIDKYEKLVNISLHDMVLIQDSNVLFSTRDGVIDDSGIKPSLLRIKLTKKSVKSMDMEVYIKRPMQLILSHNNILELVKIIQTLEKNSIISSTKIEDIKSIPKKSARKLDMIRKNLGDMRNFNLITDQIVFILKSNEYDFRFASTSIKTKIKVFDRPEKIEGTFELSNFLALNRGKIFLHPFTVQIRSKIAQEYWKKDPMIHINIISDFLKFDINSKLIQELEIFKKKFQIPDRIQQESKESCTNHHNSSNLLQIFPQSFQSYNEDMVEHFQDDLRSGAFQFIETSSIRDLPFPYQIQIIDNEIGIVCWRYPLPRALHKIKIFPVPFQTVNKVVLTCNLEYYSQIRSKFMQLCEFSLTENETKILDLKQNKPFAEIWRIKIPRVLLRRDSDDEDDGVDTMDEFQMHPKVLVACLRIDSFYVSTSIPKANILLEISNMELTLFNQMNKGVVGNEFTKYKFNNDCTREQEAARLTFKNISLMGQFFDENYENFELDGKIKGEVVENCFGNYASVFDEFEMKALLRIKYDDIDTNLSTGPINLKYSPSIGQSLIFTNKIWEQNLKNKKSEVLVLHSKFIICNNTASIININQCQATESICIMPQSFILYNFRTDKLEQKIELSVRTKASSSTSSWSMKTIPFSISQESVQKLKLDDNIYVIIRIKNYSSYQRKIIIDGAVSIYNMTKEIFNVQYRRYDKDIDAPDKCEVNDLNICDHQNASVIGIVCSDSQQAIKLRMAKNDRKIYSGEIPLREIVANNKPWLVKIPSSSYTCGYISFWVRIIRETVKDVTRVLVMIWPMFVAKSYFPMDIKAQLIGQNRNLEILGRGKSQEIDMSGTHEDEHELILDDRFIIEDSEAKVKLSYKLVNRNTFFKISDEFADIDKAVQMLEKKKKEETFKMDKILSADRDYNLPGKLVSVYHLASQKPEQLSCSLLLTLAPWCLIVNSTNANLLLKKFSPVETMIIDRNSVGIPFYIDNFFTVSLKYNDDWIESEAIYVNTDLKRKIWQSYSLPIEGQLQINILQENIVFRLQFFSSIEDKMRIIIVSPMVLIINRTQLDIRVFSFAAEVHERVEGVRRNEITCKRFQKLEKLPSESNHEHCQGVVMFTDLTNSKNKRKCNTSFDFFIALSSDASNLSIPFKIQTFNRQCLNVLRDDGNVSLAVTTVKKDDIFYISIVEDASPILSVHNNTDFDLYLAQTDMTNYNTKNVQPHKEIHDDRFPWFQLVPKKQKVFYTPPIVNETFPEINEPEYGLILACVTANDAVRWSQPLRIDGTKKIILSLPMFGDICLDVHDQRRTTAIDINYIHQDTDDSPSPTANNARVTRVDRGENCKKTFSLNHPRNRNINFKLYVQQINWTVSRDSKSVISLNIDEILVKFIHLPRKLDIEFAGVQIDNELFPSGNYDFPVVVCNKDNISKQIRNVLPNVWDLSELIEHLMKGQNFKICLDFYEENGAVENVYIKMLPIRIYIEDTFITTILEILEDCLPNNFDVETHENYSECGFLCGPEIIRDQTIYFLEPLRIRTLRVEPLHILISVHTCMRMYIALDHSPLDFSSYAKSNVYTHSLKLGNNMGMHYLSSAIFGAGWVVGSLEILGSPSGLARSLTSGIKDFVSLPAQGIFKGPWGFLVGLTQGSASLVSHVTTGALNSVTKLAGSISRNIDRLTLDQDYIHLKTDASRRNRPQGLTDGLQQGLTGFGINILGAIGGLARHPLQARSTVEVFTGVGKGLVGLVSKPISGAAELVALTGSGVLQSVGYNSLPSPLTSQNEQKCVMIPSSSKILVKQILRNDLVNTSLFSCVGTFTRKNESKNAFVILTSSTLIIVDLEEDSIKEIVPLEKMHTLKESKPAENCFSFKVIDSSSPLDAVQRRNSASKRTALYIKKLYSSNFTPKEENSEDEEEITNNIPDKPDCVISLSLEKSTGNYLMSYANLMRTQIISNECMFQIFDD